MKKEKYKNNDVYYLMKILDEIVAMELNHTKKRIMLRRDENISSLDEPHDFLLRSDENDRVFPLDTVDLQKFRSKHDIYLSEATIHTGPYADELARSMNALAVTLGMDIFFRNGSYTTSTEQGRAILSHELTHVGQYENQRIGDSENIEELEREAEAAERREYGSSDPVIPIKVDGRVYRVRKSKIREIEALSARKLSAWLEEQKILTGEDEYLSLLISAMEYRGQRR